jgi:hypothetical protein
VIIHPAMVRETPRRISIDIAAATVPKLNVMETQSAVGVAVENPTGRQESHDAPDLDEQSHSYDGEEIQRTVEPRESPSLPDPAMAQDTRVLLDDEEINETERVDFPLKPFDFSAMPSSAPRAPRSEAESARREEEPVHSRTDEELKEAKQKLNNEKLRLAITNDQLEDFKNLLEDGADLNARFDDGDEHVNSDVNEDQDGGKIENQSLLCLAARYDAVKIMNEIVQRSSNLSSDLETRTLKGSTPLSIACSFGSKNAVQRLLSLGANVSARNGSFSTPLHRA